ncbi:12545_t:CDS:1, partial [Entrophospora sp. SA101]
MDELQQKYVEPVCLFTYLLCLLPFHMFRGEKSGITSSDLKGKINSEL